MPRMDSFVTSVGAIGLVALAAASSGCRGFHGDALADRHAKLVEALESPTPEARVAALEDLRTDVAGDLPETVVDMAQDADARVRRAALATIAARGQHDAFSILITAKDDPDLQVRLTAIEGLGQLAGQDALRALNETLRDGNEPIRAAAVTALAAREAWPAVRDAVSDKSWRVRLAAAEALARDATFESAALAKTLVTDASAQVQQRAVESTATWPLELAAPVLLTAAANPTYLPSKAAIEQLAARWPEARGIAIEPPPGLKPDEMAAWKKERSRQVEELRQRWIAAHGDRLMNVADTTLRDTAREVVSEHAVMRAKIAIAALSKAGITAEESRRLLGEWRQLGEEILPALDELVRTEPATVIPDVVYLELLPGVGAEFETLKSLASTDVAVRRQATAKLAESATKVALGPTAEARLAVVLEKEQDALVWQEALRAIEAADREVTPARARLAALAVGHVSPEVRRRACVCIASWGDPKLANSLAAALADVNSSVASAAAQAVAALRSIDDPEPLLRLLAHGDKSLRIEAAAALCAIGHPAGRDALARLTVDADPKVRRKASLKTPSASDTLPTSPSPPRT